MLRWGEVTPEESSPEKEEEEEESLLLVHLFSHIYLAQKGTAAYKYFLTTVALRIHE